MFQQPCTYPCPCAGITNTLGRVATGWLADMRRLDSLVITYVAIFVCGASTAAFPFCDTYVLLCVAASVFGLSVGEWWCG